MYFCIYYKNKFQITDNEESYKENDEKGIKLRGILVWNNKELPSFFKSMEDNDLIFFIREREDEVEEILNEVLMKEGKYKNIKVLEEFVY